MKRERIIMSLLFISLLAGCTNTDHHAVNIIEKKMDSLHTPLTHFQHLPEQAPSINSTASVSDIKLGSLNSNSLKATNIVKLIPGNTVSLTFDDGPDDKYTPMILDILKQNGIHATFFVVGERAQKYPLIIKRMVEEGHVIGNHTWDHANLTKLSKQMVDKEINRTDDVLKKMDGHAPVLFRAPYGATSRNVINDATALGHRTIGWSVDTLDWAGRTPSQILSAVKKEIGPGAIVLQHSAGGRGGKLDNTVEALPQIIAYLKQLGYSFVTVPNLLLMKK